MITGVKGLAAQDSSSPLPAVPRALICRLLEF